MGLCKIPNFSIFTFFTANNLEFCTLSYSSCMYRMVRFKVWNGKVCKMMTSRFRTLIESHGVSTLACNCCTKVELSYSWTRCSNQLFLRPCPDLVLVPGHCALALKGMFRFNFQFLSPPQLQITEKHG